MKNATSVTLRVQQYSEYKFGIDYQLIFCANETNLDSCPTITSTDDIDLEETINDLNCNQTYNAYVVWISVDLTECCLKEKRDVRLDCRGMNQNKYMSSIKDNKQNHYNYYSFRRSYSRYELHVNSSHIMLCWNTTSNDITSRCYYHQSPY